MNGVPTLCDAGTCHAKDGTDLCKMFNYPCGKTPAVPSVPSLTCAKPCSLAFALGGVRGSATSNMVNVNG